MQIKISVVIPTYKRPELLRKCMHQLTNQTLEKQQYEILVVSDGPDTQSQTVVTEYFKDTSINIRFLSLPHKTGPAAARNLGWQNANGILIAFTDDDCLPDKHWLEKIVTTYRGETEIAYIGKVVVPVSERPTDFELNTKGLETGEFVTANCIVTKACLEIVDGFDEAFKAAWREDSDLQFKLLQRRVSIIKLNEAIVVHPVRKAPWGVSIKEQKKTMYNALLYKKYPRLYRQRIRNAPNGRYYFIVLSFIIFIMAAFLEVKWMMIIAFISWLLLTAAFAFQRISTTRRTFSHIFEMIATSIVIPFSSVYWTLYGSIKYRVLFF